MNKIYAYKNCDTCRKALKFLAANQIPHREIPIRASPPAPAELNAALESAGGDLRRLFNTSGSDYRALNLKEKLPQMSRDEAIDLLSQNGNLVKRPLLIGDRIILIGFKPDEWQAAVESGAL